MPPGLFTFTGPAVKTVSPLSSNTRTFDCLVSITTGIPNSIILALS